MHDFNYNVNVACDRVPSCLCAKRWSAVSRIWDRVHRKSVDTKQRLQQRGYFAIHIGGYNRSPYLTLINATVRRARTELLNRAHRVPRRSRNSSRLIARDFASPRARTRAVTAGHVTRSRIMRARPDVQSTRLPSSRRVLLRVTLSFTRDPKARLHSDVD